MTDEWKFRLDFFLQIRWRSSFWLTRGPVRVTSRVRRHLRTIQRHFTLRRACCSFEVYEIGCASPLTGSIASDGGMNSCPLPRPLLPLFSSPIYLYIRNVYVHVQSSFFFLIFLSKTIPRHSVYPNPYLKCEHLIFRRSSFVDLSDRSSF